MRCSTGMPSPHRTQATVTAITRSLSSSARIGSLRLMKYAPSRNLMTRPLVNRSGSGGTLAQPSPCGIISLLLPSVMSLLLLCLLAQVREVVRCRVKRGDREENVVHRHDSDAIGVAIIEQAVGVVERRSSALEPHKEIAQLAIGNDGAGHDTTSMSSLIVDAFPFTCLLPPLRSKYRHAAAWAGTTGPCLLVSSWNFPQPLRWTVLMVSPLLLRICRW